MAKSYPRPVALHGIASSAVTSMQPVTVQLWPRSVSVRNVQPTSRHQVDGTPKRASPNSIRDECITRATIRDHLKSFWDRFRLDVICARLWLPHLGGLSSVVVERGCRPGRGCNGRQHRSGELAFTIPAPDAFAKVGTFDPRLKAYAVALHAAASIARASRVHCVRRCFASESKGLPVDDVLNCAGSLLACILRIIMIEAPNTAAQLRTDTPCLKAHAVSLQTASGRATAT
mmetsp:Transcript_53778/g.148262  ORF Transcript_53778/g.148262 Transcript_53778/m.148262 type:complete len:231 (-) Transcript_53778:555-1247(-)